MKNLFVVISAVFMSFSAQAVETLGETVTVYMSLGSAPYNGMARGSLELKNTGDKDLTGIVWDLKGMGYRAQDNCPEALAPGKACKIYVSYWNTFPGHSSGTLKIWTSDKNYIVNLSAYGEPDPFKNPNPPMPPRYP
ncbi:MAG: hypothetical protein KUL82_04995 [Bdellovibrio sp.]|nr:hypothetical protein [Bdellovibrio sp.]